MKLNKQKGGKDATAVLYLRISGLGSVSADRKELRHDFLVDRLPHRTGAHPLSELRTRAAYRRSGLMYFLSPVGAANRCRDWFRLLFNRRSKMTKQSIYPNYDDHFEYDGGTTIRQTRKKADETVWQNWLLFDTIEAALEYFNDCSDA
jgi:hypothetical protein